MSDIKQNLEKALAKAVEDGKIPHAVVFATNADGSFTYSHAAGLLHAGSADSPAITTDALFMLASQTKLLTVLSALKAVELGLVTLDEDVGSHLPELAQLQILEGFDINEKPILKERTKPITFRCLLTHSSGAAYFMREPKLAKYNQQFSSSEFGANPLAPTVVERYGQTPLLFEPGTGFIYGCSLDWMGLLLHRLSGLPLDQFLTKHILTPLGLSPDDITFFPSAAQKAAIPTLTHRAEPGGPLAPNLAPSINTFSTDPFGGHGAYARLPAYIQLLRSLLPDAPHPLSPGPTPPRRALHPPTQPPRSTQSHGLPAQIPRQHPRRDRRRRGRLHPDPVGLPVACCSSPTTPPPAAAKQAPLCGAACAIPSGWSIPPPTWLSLLPRRCFPPAMRRSRRSSGWWNALCMPCTGRSSRCPLQSLLLQLRRRNGHCGSNTTLRVA
ncbi:hypothetical protein MRB53_040493 [Persea americana]|nr:hypothetical protein MRB53_040493 [Persea americana]